METKQKITELAQTYGNLLTSASYLDKLRIELQQQEYKLSRLEKKIEESEKEMAHKDLTDRFKQLFSKRAQQEQEEAHATLLEEYGTLHEKINALHYQIKVLTEKAETAVSIRQQLSELLKNWKGPENWTGNEKLDEILSIIKVIDYKSGLLPLVNHAIKLSPDVIHALTHNLFFLKNKQQREKTSIYHFHLSELEKFKAQWLAAKDQLLTYEQEVQKVYAYIQLGSIVDIEHEIKATEKFYNDIQYDFQLSSNLTTSIQFIQETIQKIKHRQQQFETDSYQLDGQIRQLKIKESEKTAQFKQWDH